MPLPRAVNLLRPEPQFRRECFDEGLRAAGFKVVDKLARPEPDDVLLTWNRHGARDDEAKRFRRVLVAENAYIRLKGWYALALDHHAGRGRWAVGGPERWASLGVELKPWRPWGGEVVILAQRSIGERGIASSKGWEQTIQRRIGGRIRLHPGPRAPQAPLEQDLAKASAAVTWASSAALTALIMGVPVFYGLPGWIGAGAARPVAEFAQGPLRDDAARLATLERLAWAQAPVDEIRSGEAICRLIAL